MLDASQTLFYCFLCCFCFVLFCWCAESQNSTAHLLQESPQSAGSESSQTQELYSVQAGQGELACVASVLVGCCCLTSGSTYLVPGGLMFVSFGSVSFVLVKPKTNTNSRSSPV